MSSSFAMFCRLLSLLLHNGDGDGATVVDALVVVVVDNVLCWGWLLMRLTYIGTRVRSVQAMCNSQQPAVKEQEAR
jgi:hypothetical protein